MNSSSVKIRHLATHISHVRYDDTEKKVDFLFKGTPRSIPEPSDKLLRDDLRSRIWIAQEAEHELSELDDISNLG